MRRQRFTQAIGVIALLIAAVNLLLIQDPWTAAISLVLGVLFLTGGLVVPFVWWSARKKTALFDHVEVTIDDEGVRSNLPAGQGFMAWQGIEKIDRGSGWYFVHSATSGALAIPDGAVGPDELRGIQRIALRHGVTLDGHRVDVAGRIAPGPVGDLQNVGRPDGQFVGFGFGRGIRSSAERYSDDDGLSATARRRCVQASPSRPRRLRLCPSAKCA